MQQLTDEQFVRALQLSTISTKKGWQFSTEIRIASIIAKAPNKEEVISKIEKLINTDNEQDFLDKINNL